MENYIRNKEKEQEIIDEAMDTIDFESLVEVKEYLYNLDNEEYGYCKYDDEMSFKEKVRSEKSLLRKNLKEAFDNLHKTSVSGVYNHEDAASDKFFSHDFLGIWDITVEYWVCDDVDNPYSLSCSYDLFSYHTY